MKDYNYSSRLMANHPLGDPVNPTVSSTSEFWIITIKLWVNHKPHQIKHVHAVILFQLSLSIKDNALYYSRSLLLERHPELFLLDKTKTQRNLNPHQVIRGSFRSPIYGGVFIDRIKYILKMVNYSWTISLIKYHHICQVSITCWWPIYINLTALSVRDNLPWDIEVEGLLSIKNVHLHKSISIKK